MWLIIGVQNSQPRGGNAPPPGKKSLASPEEQCRRAGHLYMLSAAAVVAVG